MKPQETQQTVVIIPAIEWEEMQKNLKEINQALETKTKSNSLGDWLTEAEAREMSGVKGTTLWRLRKDNEIISSKVANRTFYSKKSLVEYLNSNAK